ncbi:MAG: ABC transporter ATP-binding protein [Clostridiales bacterium]|jgi:simple sugar transport system ATP-binding protein|nr:ABC transporter ATP-binding protein [Clostridiales bacterium]
MDGITKIYSNGFVANRDISFSVAEGEIHALVGENGAGKTTLMKVLFGMEAPQEGAIYIEGRKAHISSQLDAIDKGIGMVHQHFMLLPSLSVAENVVLGIEPLKRGLFDYGRAVQMAQQLADRYDFSLDAKSKVEDLSVGLMQKVEILKALIKGTKVLILDEPTAVLTPQETEELFLQLFRLRDAGHAIIFISHKLEEVMRLCDKVTVLRRGRCHGTFGISELDEARISRLMVGRDVVLKMDKAPPERGGPVLEVERLVHANAAGKNAVDSLSMTVRAGEVVGIAGVEGNGQAELSDAISGMKPYSGGSVRINGSEVAGKSIREVRGLGLAYIHEDRMSFGCAPQMSVRDNIVADRYRNRGCRKGPFIDGRRLNGIADRCIEDFEIACDSRSQPVRMLSGGNIQKVVIAREFTSGGNFIMASQPTRGIDVGTTEMIRKKLIQKSREENVAVLLISADLNEVLEVSDRLLVMRKGKIVAAFPEAGKVPEDELGEYMLGLRAMEAGEMEGLL